MDAPIGIFDKHGWVVLDSASFEMDRPNFSKGVV
jgi:hypothetical protein